MEGKENLAAERFYDAKYNRICIEVYEEKIFFKDFLLL